MGGNSNSSDPSDKPKRSGDSFTVEADATREMPSITRLLNRKKLGKSKTSSLPPTQYTRSEIIQPPLAPATLIPPPTADAAERVTIAEPEASAPIEIIHEGTMAGLPKPDLTRTSSVRASTVRLADSSASETQPAPSSRPPATARVVSAPPRVQRVDRRRTKIHEVSAPIVWTIEQLRAGSDPLGKGLSLLIEKGATSALFLSISAPPPGGKVPLFVSTAATLADASRLATWTGLRWDPAIIPELWHHLLKQGYVELPVNESRLSYCSLRSSFGTSPTEALMLIRVGPVNACRGLLAVVSSRSLLLDVPKIFSLFNVPIAKSAA